MMKDLSITSTIPVAKATSQEEFDNEMIIEAEVVLLNQQLLRNNHLIQ